MTTPTPKPMSDLERVQQSYTSGSQTYKPQALSPDTKTVSTKCVDSERIPSLSRG
jgi:hypothetical protein